MPGARPFRVDDFVDQSRVRGPFPGEPNVGVDWAAPGPGKGLATKPVRCQGTAVFAQVAVTHGTATPASVRLGRVAGLWNSHPPTAPSHRAEPSPNLDRSLPRGLRFPYAVGS